MGDQKNQWEIERLKEENQDSREVEKDQEKRIRKLEFFRTETIERLKTLFKEREERGNSKKWLSQSFFYILLTGVVTLVFNFINFLTMR